MSTALVTTKEPGVDADLIQPIEIDLDGLPTLYWYNQRPAEARYFRDGSLSVSTLPSVRGDNVVGLLAERVLMDEPFSVALDLTSTLPDAPFLRTGLLVATEDDGHAALLSAGQGTVTVTRWAGPHDYQGTAAEIPLPTRSDMSFRCRVEGWRTAELAWSADGRSWNRIGSVEMDSAISHAGIGLSTNLRHAVENPDWYRLTATATRFEFDLDA